MFIERAMLIEIGLAQKFYQEIDMPKMEKLSGLWGGRYWYAEHPNMPVPFSAWLTFSESFFSGTTLEPNTIFHDGPAELSAEIEGMVESDIASFSKTYPNVDQPPVAYYGMFSDDRNRISGEWHLHAIGYFSGHFEMSRMAAGDFVKRELVIAENG